MAPEPEPPDPARREDEIASAAAPVAPSGDGDAPPEGAPNPETTRSGSAPAIATAGLVTPPAEDEGTTEGAVVEQQVDRAGTPPRAAAPAPAEMTPLSLPRPELLRITPAERELLGHMGTVVPTPRAAKRVVNIYRMLRVSVPLDELDAFLSDGGGEYQAPVLLLGVLVGLPECSSSVLDKLQAAGEDDDMWALLRGVTGIDRLLAVAEEHVTLDRSGPYRRWAPRVWRFSFRLGPDTR